MVPVVRMTRRRNRFHHALAAGPLLLLGVAACSFSFKAGGQPDDATAKPAKGGAADPGDGDAPVTSKPIADADPDGGADDAGGAGAAGGSDAPADPPPRADEPSDEGNPARQPPGDDDSGDAPGRLAPTPTTAMCRIGDADLDALCHQVLDPIASDDIDALVTLLGAGSTLIHPSHTRGHQRYTGPEAIAGAASESGGLRALLHIDPTDRVVGTVSNDCRNCRRQFVAFQFNTRSGTVEVSVTPGSPPQVFAVDASAQVRRNTTVDTGNSRQRTPPARAEGETTR